MTVIAALSGGIGGAKLAHGLSLALGEAAAELTVIVNPGDDWEWNGLLVCPDADTVLYTLAGVANPETGWGIAGDTFRCLDQLGRLGGPAWFRIGDLDLATHVLRTALLRSGVPLGECLARIGRRLGVAARVVPASDDPVRTRVLTTGGELAFQEYFVRRQARDAVRGVRFDGADAASASPQALRALREADVVILCPSNPVLSLGPILAVRGVPEAIGGRAVAVCPLVGGRAVKGPTVEVLQGLGIEPTAAGVAQLYRGVAGGFVLDRRDAEQEDAIRALGIDVLVTDTLMSGPEDRRRLAREVMAWASGRSSR